MRAVRVNLMFSLVGDFHIWSIKLLVVFGNEAGIAPLDGLLAQSLKRMCFRLRVSAARRSP